MPANIVQTPLTPFIKWAGGKRKLIPVLKQHIPAFSQYFEPFLGGGSLLLYLRPGKAIISDFNGELINCYRVVRDNPEELLALCKEHQVWHSKNYYYLVRQEDRKEDFEGKCCIERAARFIYLNKTGYGGIYRVNQNNEFNVPCGNYPNPTIADAQRIQAVSTYLRENQIEIIHADFASTVDTAPPKSLIYFDPPYLPVSKSSCFTAYTSRGFDMADQIRLRQTCDRLIERGCNVLISNSAHREIYALYSSSKYKIIQVEAARAINSDTSKRGKITELLIRNSLYFE